ncbi:M23 family metallopeptidase [Sphingobacterium hotanense]|uniref:M23 family metallopeptidase n=1 Tax=Sphingobacterium hotanense TaxID=649196 RepID=UPI0021A6506A|nr:M23 family metallopeptidase [Sphingobacterium hotanense]MCT1525820.1 M23 family metallopeptidase [Sphingobacterium hotanense]
MLCTLIILMGCQHQVTAQQITTHFSIPLRQLVVTSPYGYRIHPITGKRTFHHGVDFSARSDTVFAVIDGTVESIGNHPALGRFIRLSHGQITTVYGHLSVIGVKAGQYVRSGQAMAITGSTGRSTGEHLHFTVRHHARTIDPIRFFSLLQKLWQ